MVPAPGSHCSQDTTGSWSISTTCSLCTRFQLSVWLEHVPRPCTPACHSARFLPLVLGVAQSPVIHSCLTFYPIFCLSETSKPPYCYHRLHLHPCSQHVISLVPSPSSCQYSHPCPCLYLNGVWPITPSSCCLRRSISPPLSASPMVVPHQSPLSGALSISPSLSIPH